MLQGGEVPVPETIRLVPFEPELLPRVLPWFDHPEVQRRLGGRTWPERELALRNAAHGEEFRGRRVLRSHTFVALDGDGAPVAQIGGDVYDRWTSYAGERNGEPIVLGTIERTTMGLAYVVDPKRWGQGFGTAALRTVITHPATADVELFVAGIDTGNRASSRCALAAGFRIDDPTPDFEDTVYHFYGL